MRSPLLLLLAATSWAAVDRVDTIRITVRDLESATKFYTSVLGFQTADRPGRLRLGEETLELIRACPTGRAFPADSRSNDLWFQHVAIIVSDMDKAYAVLQRNGVKPLSKAPQTLPAWNPNAGGIRAFYFADPEGHPLEILWFPPGKGDPKWQRKDRLFLGIDHTAIAVSSTEQSLKFYREDLGMRVAGESLNYGAEQEALNNVPGAKVRITALRATSGPGVEFLEYVEPRTGRAAPFNDTPCDLVRRETVMVTDGEPGLIRDPDGHVVRLIRKSEP